MTFDEIRKKLINAEYYAKSHFVPIIREESAQFLFDFVQRGQYKNVLEIGTAIGYSGSIILSACDCRLTTLEIDQLYFSHAKETFENLELGQRVEQILGDAKISLDQLIATNQKFDLVFLDSSKGQYINYLPKISKLLKHNGVILADNVLFHGMVESDAPIPHGKRSMVRNLRKYLDAVNSFPFETELVRIEDGIAVTRFKGGSMIELLAPAGNMEKLKTAFYFGADACYMAGKKFGLRAFSDNFDEDELDQAVAYAHSLGKKIYITVNILAHNNDFDGLKEYLQYLESLSVDGIIVSDLGVMQFAKTYAPNLEIHISTQSSITNKHSAKMYADLGAMRLVLARELSLQEIKEIRGFLPKSCELETFVHGAMCISYSGRCLLSNFMSGRDSNRGACVQACRFEYTIREKSRNGEEYPIEQDEKGTYILNSKDLCMIRHVDKLVDAGVQSFKIEGRMKSAYYVATVVNAYRRAIDNFLKDLPFDESLYQELEKTSHRRFTTGFYFDEKDREYLENSLPIQSHEFMAIVLKDAENGFVTIQQRNRFRAGDELEVLSPSETFNTLLKVANMYDENDKLVTDASLVQQTIKIKTDLHLKAGDILRKKV